MDLFSIIFAFLTYCMLNVVKFFNQDKYISTRKEGIFLFTSWFFDRLFMTLTFFALNYDLMNASTSTDYCVS